MTSRYAAGLTTVGKRRRFWIVDPRMASKSKFGGGSGNAVADNQNYGFGNSFTESQKSNLIFGGLGGFFVLFMAGYALN